MFRGPLPELKNGNSFLHDSLAPDERNELLLGVENEVE